MGSRTKSEAAKRLALILEKETAKTSVTEWLRYAGTILLDYWIALTDEQAHELKRNMSGEAHKQLSSYSVCQLKAMDVRTDEWYTVMLIQKPEGKLILDLKNCTGCDVGKTIDFDFSNSFWKDNNHSGCDRVFYETRLSSSN